MSATVAPLTEAEFETVKRRVLQNADAPVDPQVALRLVVTVDALQQRVLAAPMGHLVELWP